MIKMRLIDVERQKSKYRELQTQRTKKKEFSEMKQEIAILIEWLGNNKPDSKKYKDKNGEYKAEYDGKVMNDLLLETCEVYRKQLQLERLRNKLYYILYTDEKKKNV